MTATASAPSARDEDVPFSPDPTGDWIRAHLEELRLYSGRHVAIDPARGVVAAGTYREVVDALKVAGISFDSGVVITWVN